MTTLRTIYNCTYLQSVLSEIQYGQIDKLFKCSLLPHSCLQLTHENDGTKVFEHMLISFIIVSFLSESYIGDAFDLPEIYWRFTYMKEMNRRFIYT